MSQSPNSAIVPHSDIPDGTGLTIYVRVVLDGSYPPAQQMFAKVVQGYAEKLASESARQEASGRAPGARNVEITESAVIRAQESLERETVKRQRPANALEAFALAGTPILAGATGVMGSYLHSPLQVVVFALLAVGAVSCILYLLRRRLL